MVAKRRQFRRSEAGAWARVSIIQGRLAWVQGAPTWPSPPAAVFSRITLSRAPYSNKPEVKLGLYLAESEGDDLRLNQAESIWEVQLEGPRPSHWTCPDDAPRCPESPHWGFVRERQRDLQPACTPGHQHCFSFEGFYRVSTSFYEKRWTGLCSGADSLAREPSGL